MYTELHRVGFAGIMVIKLIAYIINHTLPLILAAASHCLFMAIGFNDTFCINKLISSPSDIHIASPQPGPFPDNPDLEWLMSLISVSYNVLPQEYQEKLIPAFIDNQNNQELLVMLYNGIQSENMFLRTNSSFVLCMLGVDCEAQISNIFNALSESDDRNVSGSIGVFMQDYLDKDLDCDLAYIFLEYADSEDMEVKEACIFALGAYPNNSNGVQTLLAAIDSQNCWIRRSVALSIANIIRSDQALACDPGIHNGTVALLHDESSLVRGSALYILKESPVSDDIQELLASVFYTDPDVAIRVSAMFVMASNFQESALPVFLDALKDKNPEIRIYALHFIVEFLPYKEAIVYIKNAIDDSSKQVRAEARRLIRYLREHN